MSNKTRKKREPVSKAILEAKRVARAQTQAEPELQYTSKVRWPISCTVGPGLEGAIACESRVGYVNGAKGWLIYRGYDIFDLSAHSSYEETAYLLLHGRLPSSGQLKRFKDRLSSYRHLPGTLRRLMSFPVENMNAMAALRLGVDLMRRGQTLMDQEGAQPPPFTAISADEDSLPMETKPMGTEHAVYEFRGKARHRRRKSPPGSVDPESVTSCYHLIAGVPTIAAAIARIREGKMPIEPDPELGHAANFLYMLTGRRPTPLEEKLMDVALILHADHGMNASTFACLVVASTLSDIYFSVGAGIAALNGPLHGGANEEVIRTLREIGGSSKVSAWFEDAMRKRAKIAGFGHRVYKAYDPRARILGPLAKMMAPEDAELKKLLNTAVELERRVVDRLGETKKVFPNVDFYSGIVYASLGVPTELFTPVFAVSRVAGWTARLLEYLRHNRIFRPRAIYLGKLHSEYVPIDKRPSRGRGKVPADSGY